VRRRVDLRQEAVDVLHVVPAEALGDAERALAAREACVRIRHPSVSGVRAPVD